MQEEELESIMADTDVIGIANVKERNIKGYAINILSQLIQFHVNQSNISLNAMSFKVNGFWQNLT